MIICERGEPSSRGKNKSEYDCPEFTPKKVSPFLAVGGVKKKSTRNSGGGKNFEQNIEISSKNQTFCSPPKCNKFCCRYVIGLGEDLGWVLSTGGYAKPSDVLLSTPGRLYHPRDRVFKKKKKKKTKRQLEKQKTKKT
ncbi:hypothetical protein RUM43_005977 [Polyplax serrata]|uniref:Uncharacterized protein n=1 Tax=Polyplax serrata TaxID=468196 RepID=A0AAN8P0Q9_POLSC